MLVVRSREAGNIIDYVETIEKGLEIIKMYEEEDKHTGEYTENFYEVAEIDN